MATSLFGVVRGLVDCMYAGTARLLNYAVNIEKLIWPIQDWKRDLVQDEFSKIKWRGLVYIQKVSTYAKMLQPKLRYTTLLKCPF